MKVSTTVLIQREYWRYEGWTVNDPARAWWAMHLMCILSGSKLNKFMNPAWGMAGCLAWWCVGCRSRQKAALVETSGIPLLLRGWEGEAM